MSSPFAIAKPQHNDALQVAAAKLAYYLQAIAVAYGASSSPTTMFLPSMAPNYNDSLQACMVKAAYWAQQISANSGTGGLTKGTGAPPVNGSVTTSFYFDTATSLFYINSGTVAAPVWNIH